MQFIIRKGITVTLCMAVLLAYSMVTQAVPARVVGALTVSQTVFDGTEPLVTVNGELARSGRSVLSTSVISTSGNAVASLYFGRLGRLEVLPNSEVTLSFDSEGITGKISKGRVNVLAAGGPIRLESESEGPRLLASGESIVNDSPVQDDDDADLKKNGVPSWVWAVLIGGVIAGVAAGASGGSGGSPRPVSPVQ